MSNFVEQNCNGLKVQVTPITKQLIQRCKNAHLTLARTSNHIKFLRRCRKNKVIPKGLRPKVPNIQQKKNLEEKFGLNIIKQQLSNLHKLKRDVLRDELHYRSCIQREVDPTTWTIVWTWILVLEREEFLKMRSTQLKKFQHLEMQKISSEQRGASGKCRVWNLSTRELSESELKLLSKGLNFVPCCKNKVSADSVANTEVWAKRMGDKGQILVDLTKSYLQGNNHQDNLSKEERIALQTLKEDDNIIVTTADKGKSVVVLDKGEYNNKMLELLKSGNYKRIEDDPTIGSERKLKTTLDTLRGNGFLELKFVQRVMHCNTRIPTIYGCPKVHKEGNPLRPVVSTAGTQWSELARFLVKIINPLATPAGCGSIKNTQEFVQDIKKLKINSNELLISLDVTNLFGSVPVNQCLALVRQALNEDLTLHLRTTLPISTIMELITECINQSYFKFNDEFYVQELGLAMGSPLSPGLANIYLNNFQTRFETCTMYNFLEYLRRYVDDYFGIWSGNLDELDTFVEEINALEPTMKFTKEVEEDGKLPFLDVVVKRDGEKLTTSMYTKPSCSGIILNYDSNHSDRVKLNIVQNLSGKIKMCSDTPKEDLDVLKAKLKDNGYPDKIINKGCVENNTHELAQGKKPRKKGPIVLPLQTEKQHGYRRKVSNLGLNVAFKRNRNLGEIISKKGKTNGLRETCVIYKISCECGQFYIGETGREISIRIGEHKYATTKENKSNGIARHIMETKHKMDFEHYEILHREQNENKRKIKEAYFIRKLKPTLNLNKGVEISDIWLN